MNSWTRPVSVTFTETRAHLNVLLRKTALDLRRYYETRKNRMNWPSPSGVPRASRQRSPWCFRGVPRVSPLALPSCVSRDRTCEKYLSLERPIQRYEFLAHIRWHNEALYDDLVRTGMLRGRASAVAGEVPSEGEWGTGYGSNG